MRVIDAAVQKAYGGKRKIHWMEVYAGEKSNDLFNTWLPDETVAACREYLVSIKGPLTTPVGGGIRSLNVALRQMLDLYVCLRPVRWFKGVPSPVKAPGEGRHGDLPREHRGHLRRHRVRGRHAPTTRSSSSCSRRRSRRQYAQDPLPEHLRHRHQAGVAGRHGAAVPRRHRVRDRQQAQERDDRAQGQHHEVHRRRVPQLGYALAEKEFGEQTYTWDQWERTKAAKGEKAANDEQDAAKKAGKILIKDAIADITLQQVLTRPDEFDVIATMNLNGDYLSDALAAQVGGIGIAPGGNINYVTGHAVFEATHGTAPKYANLDKVNPGSVILSGEMMLRYMGWIEAADAIITRDGQDDRPEDRHLRLRAPDGRREGSEVQRVRRRADPQPVM